MAVYRKVNINFWQDDFILELTPEEKFFYMYLMTNTKTKQCGIYQISRKVISFETGLNDDTISGLLKKFINCAKIEYDENTHEILILNWLRYNSVNNINIFKCVAEELRWVKSRKLLDSLVKILDGYTGKWLSKPGADDSGDFAGACKGLIRGLHTPTKKEEKEKEKEEEEEETKGEEKEKEKGEEKEKEESAVEEKPDEEIMPEAQFLCPNSIEFGRISFFEINKVIKHKPPDIKPPGQFSVKRYIFPGRSTFKRKLVRKNVLAVYSGKAFKQWHPWSGVNIPP